MITNVGAYLLGGLDPADRVVYEAHLAGCPVCEAEVLRMAPLPGLLQRIGEPDFDYADFDGADPGGADHQDPDHQAPGHLDPAREHAGDPAGRRRPRRGPLDDDPVTKPVPLARRPRAPLVVAAAVAVVLALAGIAAVTVFAPGEPAMVTWSAHDPVSGIRADVALTERPWGTELSIRMRDVPPGKPCKLVVRARDGSRETAGWWAAGTKAEEEIPGSTSFDLAAIARVEVVSGDDVVIDITPPD